MSVVFSGSWPGPGVTVGGVTVAQRGGASCAPWIRQAGGDPVAYPKCGGKLPASHRERTGVIRFYTVKRSRWQRQGKWIGGLQEGTQRDNFRIPCGSSGGHWTEKGCWWLSSTTVSEEMERSEMETYFGGCL